MNYIFGKALIIDYTSLPEDIQQIIGDWNEFGNNRCLPFYSNLDKITLENYNAFISNEDNETEELLIEKFLLDSKIELLDVDVILFNLYW